MAAAGARAFEWMNLGCNLLDQRAGVVRVCEQYPHDVRDLDGVVVWMPAVVIRHHADRGVTDLRFASEGGFGKVRHADDIATPALVQLRFGESGELRPLHGKVGSPSHYVQAQIPGAVVRQVCEALADWMRHGNMRDHAALEECLDAIAGPIDELINHHEGSGSQLLLERSDRTQGEDLGYAGSLQDIDVGPVIDGARRKRMAAPVTGQEDQLLSFELAKQKLIGGIAKGGAHRLPLKLTQSLDLIDSASTDDSQYSCHVSLHLIGTSRFGKATWYRRASIIQQANVGNPIQRAR